MAMPGLANLQRRHIVIGAIRSVTTSVIVLVLYFVVPINERAGATIAFRLVAGLAFFAAVLAYEVRSILRSPQPFLRAANALALVIPLFLLVFAWTYLTMGLSDPGAFSEVLDRPSALYFTVTTFSTVGYGDIHAVSDPARMVVTLQMAADLIVIAVVVRLILEAARGAVRSNQN